MCWSRNPSDPNMNFVSPGIVLVSFPSSHWIQPLSQAIIGDQATLLPAHCPWGSAWDRAKNLPDKWFVTLFRGICQFSSSMLEPSVTWHPDTCQTCHCDIPGSLRENTSWYFVDSLIRVPEYRDQNCTGLWLSWPLTWSAPFKFGRCLAHLFQNHLLYKKNGVETSILWRVFCPHPALCYGNEAQLLLGPKGWQLKLLGVRPVRPRAETGFSKNIFSSNPPPLSSFTWWYVCTVNGKTWRNFPVGSHVLIWTSATWLQPRSLSVSIDHHYPSGDVHKEVHEQRRHEIVSQAQLSIGTCPCSSTSPNP